MDLFYGSILLLLCFTSNWLKLVATSRFIWHPCNVKFVYSTSDLDFVCLEDDIGLSAYGELSVFTGGFRVCIMVVAKLFSLSVRTLKYLLS